MQHILSLSYGKDSMALIYVVKDILHWPLDRIVSADVWATPTIPAELPPMVEFKKKADAVILDRWGIAVEHVSSGITYEEQFYQTRIQKNGAKCIYGFPCIKGGWCNDRLKMKALRVAQPKNCIAYLGIAADEPNRFHTLSATKKSPLVEAGWTESDCRKWCEENDLLSPIYTTSARGGCWFCHNQGVDQLRQLRHNYPEYWKLMLKWDNDSPVTFHADGHTVHDFDKRFEREDSGLIGSKFSWNIIKDDRPSKKLF